MNNLSDNVDFESHFDIQKNELYKIDSNDASKEQQTPYKQITTVTTSAPLFKYILTKHLEKYKYYRIEYIKDFYIASDLVCKKFINYIYF